MKKRIFKIFIVITLLFAVSICNCPFITSAMKTDPKNITVKILKANKKYIKIKLLNNSGETFYYWGGFQLKKYTNHKWKKVKLLDNYKFAKTVSLDNNETRVVKLKWKKYFRKNLSKGKYKIKLVKTRNFFIN